MTQELELYEDKKHSVRYNALKADQDPIVTSIYIMKGRLPRPFPKKIKLNIEVAE